MKAVIVKKINAKNERIKRDYFLYLEEAKRLQSSSVDKAASAISEFEKFTGYRDFALFHIERAKSFKQFLNDRINAKSKAPLSKATIYSRLMALKTFFLWLAGQQGYRSKISYSDADYFNPSAHDSRIAATRREKRVPTLEQVQHVITSMPCSTDVELRDKALIAFTLLTGARDSAIASMKLKHINLSDCAVFQDAREVATKNRKTFTSYFFPVGDSITQIITDWIKHLKTVLLFGPDDPLFPSTEINRNSDGLFAPSGLNRNHWRSAAPIRRIFKHAFETVKLPYANPHSLRNTLAQFGERTCRTPEEFKAWSQNLGHEGVLTTFMSYGTVASSRQSEIILGLADRPSDAKTDNNDRLSHIEIMLAKLTSAQNQSHTPL